MFEDEDVKKIITDCTIQSGLKSTNWDFILLLWITFVAITPKGKQKGQAEDAEAEGIGGSIGVKQLKLHEVIRNSN